MDNPAAISPTSQTSLNTGNPLNPQPISPLASESATTSTVEAIVSTPLEPVDLGQDTAVTSSKTNLNPSAGDTSTNGSNFHKMQMDDGDGHPEKPKSACAMLNKLFLVAAIVCFALFLASIAYIVANLEGLNGKYHGQRIEKFSVPFSSGDEFCSSERLISERFFNLTNGENRNIIVTVSRRGAAIHDIFLTSKDSSGTFQTRSIVLKGGDQSYFGSVRFGFDDPKNPNNLTSQLPSNYVFLNFHQDEWLMYADPQRPSTVRFVNGLIQVIYKFSLSNPNELLMTTMVATPSNQHMIVDPTNNIYFNLRGAGNLSSHFLNLSLSTPIDILTGQRVEQDRLIQSQRLDKLLNINNYFYLMDRAGIGKNHIATLTEIETKTTLNIFSDHTGLVIDPFGVGLVEQNVNPVSATPELRGVRLSPRQSPIYQPTPLYGRTSIVYPSQAIHTTWWQFEFDQ